MTPYDDVRPSGRGGGTPFEQELVSAMNDFADSATAPAFEPDVIARSSRRKRGVAVAALTAAAVIVGAGTALATIGHGTNGAGPAAGAKPTVPATASPAITEVNARWHFAQVELVTQKGHGLATIDLAGLTLKDAKTMLSQHNLRTGSITWAPCTGRRGTVLMVFHGTPRLVKAVGDPDYLKGMKLTDTVNVDLCSGNR